jgi:hypothetical protein
MLLPCVRTIDDAKGVIASRNIHFSESNRVESPQRERNDKQKRAESKEQKPESDDLERRATSPRVEVDNLVEAHDTEERLRVHALRGREVGAGLLQRAHRGSDPVVGGDARHERED